MPDLSMDTRAGAVFDGENRLTLSRDWGSGPRALVIGCNPSLANAERDDPTSRWWNRWFRAQGFGGYDAVNLYPFCTSHPVECRRIVGTAGQDAAYVHDAIHRVNLPHLVAKAKAADRIFVCWGAIAWDRDFVEQVVAKIQAGAAPSPDLWCWGKTANGAPIHPLARGRRRLEPDQKAVVWRAAP